MRWRILSGAPGRDDRFGEGRVDVAALVAAGGHRLDQRRVVHGGELVDGRDRRGHDAQPVEDPEVLDNREDAPEASPVHRAEQREHLDLVRDELAQLPELERVVVELRHLEDWSFERIARELGIAASTVKDRCYRGLSRIEERLRRRDVGA